MIEIDDFQKIHKLHSKAVANKVLVEFVLLLEDLLRDTDILFRIEEAKFAVLTPETGESGGLKAAKRIRELDPRIMLESYPNRRSRTRSFNSQMARNAAICFYALLKKYSYSKFLKV